MHINHTHLKPWAALFLAAALLTGCGFSQGQASGGADSGSAQTPSQTQTSGSGANSTSGTAPGSSVNSTPGTAPGAPISYETDPATFSLTVNQGDISVPVSVPGQTRQVANYTSTDGETAWEYPDASISVSVKPEPDFLRVTITSESAGDNHFDWPQVAGDSYYIPLGEGKRIPAQDQTWQSYVSGREFSVMEQLSMPFWSAVHGDYAVRYIMEQPYRSILVFGSGSPIEFGVAHAYPAIDAEKTSTYRIYLTDNDPVSAAKLYRQYVQNNGSFVTLEEKASQNPNIRKLYDAPHIYLWGENVISPEDINWPALRNALDHPDFKHLMDQAERTETGSEALQAVKAISGQDYVDQYQKNVLCRYISEILKLDSLYQWNGPGNPSAYDLLQFNMQTLAEKLPDVFRPADQWMEGGTTALLSQLKEAGIDRAWIGLNSWEQGYAKPELVKQAADQGYLMGPYDSYHSIHEPGREQWITAAFQDETLYENAAVENQKGEKISGFKNVGRKLSPLLSLPSVRQRTGEILASGLPFNSWFIDCDATGEIYDDYTPGRIATQQQDLKARLERMTYIRDQHQMVIGSEGGNDFAASTIAFAHGIELPTFSWMDEDMKSNKESPYYIGKYYNPTGGVAEHLAKRVPVKEQFMTIFADPKYDVPLYKLVYNDSVITTYHWDWSTFKIIGAVQNRMLREVLYNVPPLYHLDSREWDTYKDAISSHTTFWSQFSRQAVLQEMTGFKYLSDDGSVQLAQYGEDLWTAANFSDVPFNYEGMDIPAHSLILKKGADISVYTPNLSEDQS